MFDDVQPPKTGNTPNNLPLGEPEDIFEPTDTSSPVSTPVEPTVSQNSALDAGVLKPKTSAVSELRVPEHVQTVPTPVPQAPSTYTLQTPSSPFLQEEQQGALQGMGQAAQEAPFSARKIFVFIAIILVIALLGFGSFSIYTRYIKTDISENNFSTGGTVNTGSIVETPVTSTDTTPNTQTIIGPNTSTNAENSILFGEPADTDSDGIIDVDEARYGTDTLNWDTDGDELSDGDEVLIWKTNPLAADSDFDGYSDSVEIRNGYNPLGTGKLFEPPTTTPQTSTTTP